MSWWRLHTVVIVHLHLLCAFSTRTSEGPATVKSVFRYGRPFPKAHSYITSFTRRSLEGAARQVPSLKLTLELERKRTKCELMYILYSYNRLCYFVNNVLASQLHHYGCTVHAMRSIAQSKTARVSAATYIVITIASGYCVIAYTVTHAAVFMCSWGGKVDKWISHLQGEQGPEWVGTVEDHWLAVGGWVVVWQLFMGPHSHSLQLNHLTSQYILT